MDWFAHKYHVVSYSRRCAYPNTWFDNNKEANYSTVQNNADDLAESIIKRLNLAPAHIVGHSYGAFTALYLAYSESLLLLLMIALLPTA
jgi:non-heme chloroperoxidase